jgi:hypothetical protein
MTSDAERKSIIDAGKTAGWDFQPSTVWHDGTFIYTFLKEGRHVDVYFRRDGTISQAWAPSPHGRFPDPTPAFLSAYLKEYA